VSIPALSSFEFLALLDEAIELLSARGIHKFVLFVDEANKLTLESNTRIIRENLSLFSAKGLQFCFVTTPEVLTVVPEPEDLFQARLELGPFATRDSLDRLVETYSQLVQDCVVSFAPAALDAIWRLSQGFPYRVQLLCNRSFLKACERGSSVVELQDVLEAIPEQGQW